MFHRDKEVSHQGHHSLGWARATTHNKKTVQLRTKCRNRGALPSLTDDLILPEKNIQNGFPFIGGILRQSNLHSDKSSRSRARMKC